MYEIEATFGSQQTECTVYVSGCWYAVEGSVNVNRALDDAYLVDGIDIETIPDIDTSTSLRAIESVEHLEAHVREDYESFFGVSEDSHDVYSMWADFNNNNLELDSDFSGYAWKNKALNNWINGNKRDALSICEEHGINPVDLGDESLTRAFCEQYI